MPHVAVTVNARVHLALGFCRKHLVDNIDMAIEASVLRHPAIPRLDLYWFMKVLQREGQRMKKSVVGLGDPLADGMMRQVAVVTNCDMAMAGILPRVIVSLHDVAIRARRGIVAEIAPALAVTECERADAANDSKHYRYGDRKERI
jgi:hypothetical protein